MSAARVPVLPRLAIIPDAWEKVTEEVRMRTESLSNGLSNGLYDESWSPRPPSAALCVCDNSTALRPEHPIGTPSTPSCLVHPQDNGRELEVEVAN